MIFHKIIQDDSTGHYLIALHASLVTSVANVQGLSMLMFNRDGTGKIEGGIATNLSDSVCNDISNHVHMCTNFIY